ncbi:membrane protein [soil metagenome]
MTPLYLWFNAVMYAVFALWCALRLDSTSQNLGYTALSNSGRSEYFTVYGGLQWGLALVFAWLAFKPELHRTGLLVALALYAPLVLHRSISLVRFGPVETLTRAVAGLEIAMLVIAAALWFLGSSRAQA